MKESPRELRELQELLDRSPAMSAEIVGPGEVEPRVVELYSPEQRLSARRLCDQLQGVTRLLIFSLTAPYEPHVAIVEAIFLHGKFHFRSNDFGHLRRLPGFNLTNQGEGVHVSVSGTGELIEPGDPAFASIEAEFDGLPSAAGAACVRVEPLKMWAWTDGPNR